jgi:hypothetical protein
MWVKRMDREELLLLAGGNAATGVRGAEKLAEIREPLRPREIRSVWRRDPFEVPQLPEMIVLQQMEKRDFLAWTSTYFPNIRPFTAYCRVLGPVEASDHFHGRVNPTLKPFENACVGIILGETIALARGRMESFSFTPLSCGSTFSFAASRHMAIYDHPWLDVAIGNDWEKARVLTKQTVRSISPEVVFRAWEVLWEVVRRAKDIATGSQNPIIDAAAIACSQIASIGRVERDTWSDLIGNHPELSSVHELMEGTREDRVVAFERAIAVFQNIGHRSPFTRDFAIGYLASRIGPGSLDHAPLLASQWPDDPAPLVWLGLCAGLYPSSDIQAYARGVGRRVLRDILVCEADLERPRCDLSLSELEVLMAGDNPTMDFMRYSPTYLSIELRPRIVATVRWPALPPSTESTKPTHSQLTQKIETAISRLQDVYSSLTGKEFLFEEDETPRTARKRRKQR